MSTPKTASIDALSSLHDTLATAMKDALKADPGNPALMSVIRQFLKDNKIEAQAKKGSPLGDLADLPVFDDLDDQPGDLAH